MNEETKTLPRRDSREAAFRKYEPFIARGLIGETTIDPKVELDLSATTFVARFRDAVLAKKKFGYKSRFVPDGVSLENLTADELENGLVLIKNATAAPANVIPPDDKFSEERIVALMNEVASKKVTAHYLTCPSHDILLKVIDIVNKHVEIDCVVAVEGKSRLHFYTL